MESPRFVVPPEFCIGIGRELAADLFQLGVRLPRRTADVSDDLLDWLFQLSGFLSHLHSLAVTMSQKSSLVQQVRSVSKALTPDSTRLDN